MIATLLIAAARSLVIGAFVFALVVALTHWAVRSRRLGPFAAFPRTVRRMSDPIVKPLERRIVRAGGNPQDAPLWLLGIAVGGGLVLLSLLQWAIGTAISVGQVAAAGPHVMLLYTVDGFFGLLMAAILIRVIASWFGISPYAKWMRPIVLLTDWLLEPLRRILPPFGMIDMSPMVAWLLLWLARWLVRGLLS